MTTPPTPPTDNLAAEGGPRSEMSEQDGVRDEIAGVLRGRLPQLLADEYGEEPRDWCELGSTRRISNHLADALADLLAARDRRVRAVLDEYFNFDIDPWDDHDGACPAPEDIWRLHRDLKAALRADRIEAP